MKKFQVNQNKGDSNNNNCNESSRPLNDSLSFGSSSDSYASLHLSTSSLLSLLSSESIITFQKTFKMDPSDGRILIPDFEDERFSFRKLWMFTGPGFLMSIAFLDPGNIESDLRSGAVANYKLLWVLFSSTVMGLLMQRLSARLGVVTGQHLAELCYQYYHKVPRLLLWIMIEIAIIGSDMQEVIGTAIALYLLSAKAIPLWAGVLITILDTFTFLFLDKYGLRKLECFFAILIAIMAFSFGYEYAISQSSKWEIIKGMFVPWCSNCNSNDLLQAIGIIGAVLMPHNFYLHSALVRTRQIDRKNKEAIKEANFYYFIETCIALLISFLINVCVVSVFAYGMFHVTNNEILNKCKAYPTINGTEVFPQNDEYVDADIYKGGIFLGCSFGLWAMYIWGVGILAAGQSSTMTGTYAGQFVMEGFLNLKWARWKRVLFTRVIAIMPTFWLASRSTHSSLTDLNDILNATMTLQLPFAIIPTIAFTSSEDIMGSFKNGKVNTIMASVLSTSVIIINTYFVINQVKDLQSGAGTYLLIFLYAVFYLTFIAYLLVHMFVALGYKSFLDYTWVQRYVVLNTKQMTDADNCIYHTFVETDSAKDSTASTMS